MADSKVSAFSFCKDRIPKQDTGLPLSLVLGAVAALAYMVGYVVEVRRLEIK